MMETLTHSKRSAYLNCPRYFFNRFERHLRPRITKPGRRRGAAFGDAIFAVSDSGIPLERDTQTLAEVIASSVALSYAEVSPSDQEEADEIELEQVKIKVLAFGYVGRYGVERGKREIVFDQPLVNPATNCSSRAFRRGGKIDGLVSLGNGRWRVIEDKFVGQIQKAMIDRLPLDAQSNEYVDALLSIGLDAEIAYRHTLNPTSKPKLVGAGLHRRRETLEEYEVRLIQDVTDRPEHYYDEQILLFPKERLDDYRRGRWGTAQMILEARRNAKTVGWQTAWPQNSSKCWEYGGCSFIALCTRGEEAIDMYTTEPDNVELGGTDASSAQEGTGSPS
jgi:hypothetical protein